LDISYNNISKFDDVVILAKCIPDIVDLNFLRNPITDLKGYRITTLRRLTSLTILDTTTVSDQEKVTAGILLLSVCRRKLKRKLIR
jgi:hypothetical protein